MNVYFVSGLGADKRAFQNIKLPPGFFSHHVEWIEPLKAESIKLYVKRLSKQMDLTRPFVLIGLSFGGVIAIELNKLFPAQKIILISSISRRNELPVYFKVAGLLKMDKLIPAFILKIPNLLTYYLFGLSRREEKNLMKEILKETSLGFLK